MGRIGPVDRPCVGHGTTSRASRSAVWSTFLALAVLVVLVVLGAVATPAGAQQPTTTTADTTTEPGEVEPEVIDLDWSLTLPADPVAMVLVDDAVVVVDADATLSAVSLDGDLRWETELLLDGEPLRDPRQVEAAGDHIAVLGENENGIGALVAVSAVDGSPEWSQVLDRRFGSFSMVSDDDTFYVAITQDLAAIDAGTGRTRWTGDRLEARRWDLAGVVDGAVLAWAQIDGVGTPVALDAATGDTVWTSDVDVDWVAVVEGEVVMGGADLRAPDVTNSLSNSAMAGFDPATGERRWDVLVGQQYGLWGVAKLGDVVLIAAGTPFAGYDIERNEEVWRVSPRALTDSTGEIATAPVVVGDLFVLALVEPFGQDRTGVVVGIGADGAAVFTSPVAGVPVAMAVGPDGTMLVAAETGAGPPVLASFTLPAQPEVPEVVEEVDEPEESVLLGLPTPSEAITAKNVGLASLLFGLLLILVVVPSTLFNEALESRLAQMSSRTPWWRRGRRRTAKTTPPRRAMSRRSVWTGLVVYLALASAVYSLLEPSWGLNGATVMTALSFFITLGLILLVEFTMIRIVAAHRHGTGGGRPQLWFGSLGIAAVCVAGSRAIGFIPGFSYGVVADYATDKPLTDEDESLVEVLTAIVILVLSVGAWFVLSMFTALGDGWWAQFPSAIAGAVFLAGVETMMIGLLPLRLLPGEAVRRHHPHLWKVLWGSSGFLFCLVLLHPGLVTAQARSTGWMMLAAAAYGGGAVAFWYVVRRRTPDAVGPPSLDGPPPAPATAPTGTGSTDLESPGVDAAEPSAGAAESGSGLQPAPELEPAEPANTALGQATPAPGEP